MQWALFNFHESCRHGHSVFQDEKTVPKVKLPIQPCGIEMCSRRSPKMRSTLWLRLTYINMAIENSHRHSEFPHQNRMVDLSSSPKFVRLHQAGDTESIAQSSWIPIVPIVSPDPCTSSNHTNLASYWVCARHLPSFSQRSTANQKRRCSQSLDP